jgi:hypothetical protein
MARCPGHASWRDLPILCSALVAEQQTERFTRAGDGIRSNERCAVLPVGDGVARDQAALRSHAQRGEYFGAENAERGSSDESHSPSASRCCGRDRDDVAPAVLRIGLALAGVLLALWLVRKQDIDGHAVVILEGAPSQAQPDLRAA